MKKPHTKSLFSPFGVCIAFIPLFLLQGCSLMPETVTGKSMLKTIHEGIIMKTDTGSPVAYKDFITELSRARIIYVGENHSDPAHHEIQLNIIKDIYQFNQTITVGMEMFDQTYQPILDQWTDGKLDRKTFLKKTHWYANWKMDDELYADILEYLKEKRIRLIALNVPFHIPPKIATGGIASLSEAEKRYLPEEVNLSNNEHRRYVKKIFDLHQVMGMDDFENFYSAQCVWEDAMAEAIARHAGSHKMIIITGNGHIVQKFGIPDRAYKRTSASFRTVVLTSAGMDAGPPLADYIWITPSLKKGLLRYDF